MVVAIVREIISRSHEAEGLSFNTIYFGGGTPSILGIGDVEKIFSSLYRSFKISKEAEITIEANPDDISEDFLEMLRKYTPVNRLSIGIQSFNDHDLVILNRIHNSAKGLRSVEMAKRNGFSNLNIDLIYAIPGSTLQNWEKNLLTFKSLDVPHLSAYELTVEPHTVFAYFRKKGRIAEKQDEEKVEQFLMLKDFTAKEGYEHYEISNYARPGFHSIHNLGYWSGEPYLGFGPSAHSFSGGVRRWNLSNNTLYLDNIETNRNEYFETEVITSRTAYNEYLLTSLRTMWGSDTNKIKSEFGKDVFEHFMKEASRFIKSGKLVSIHDHVMLSSDGMLIADYITSELMLV